MGRNRYIGPEVPKEDLIWQDPLPQPIYNPTEQDIIDLKFAIADSGLSVSELVSVAWGVPASTFRGGDKRGGANGARLALTPQRDWDVNAEPFVRCQFWRKFRKSLVKPRWRISSCWQVWLALTSRKRRWFIFHVPFAPGRVDARQDQTDIEMFELLEPIADGFRNYRARLGCFHHRVTAD